MRIRTVKPSFWADLTLASLPHPVRLHFIGLWNYADDEGKGIDEPRLLKAALWPLDDAVTARKVEGFMESLAAVGRIVRYEVDGTRYFQVRNWNHQRIDRPQESNIPDPIDGDSTSVPGTSVEVSRLYRKGKEGKGEEKEGKGLAALTPQQHMFGEVCLGMGYDQNLSADDAKEVGGVAKALLAKNLAPEEVPAYLDWLSGPESPIVNGTRLTLHSLPKWVKDWRATPRVVKKPTGSARNVSNILALAERMGGA